ncbi:MAG: creatininase family protein [Saprospiraceae bacterium]|nr:creatininase family protein [Saprospiraceae bacterium]
MNKDFKPYVLAETNWKITRELSYDLAILPWGATEAHNYHLPYATDNYQVNYVAEKAAGKAWVQGAKPVLLPCVPFGVNTGQMDVTLCINMRPSTQLAVLTDIADVLSRHQIHKLVILNGHGGNSFKSMIRELSLSFPQVFVVWINWYHVVEWQSYFDDPGDHAGEMETSAMMHIRPDLVRSLDEAGDGQAKSFRLSGFREGWAISQREWSKITEDTGVGNPTKASAEKGKKYLDATIEKLATFLKELAETPREDLYQ